MAQAMGSAPRPSMHDRLCAVVRRQPYMTDHAVDVGELVWQTLGASLFIVFLPVVTPFRTGLVLVYAVALATRPFVRAHLAGAHHRWAALAAALAVGLATGAVMAFVLGDGRWAMIA